MMTSIISVKVPGRLMDAQVAERLWVRFRLGSRLRHNAVNANPLVEGYICSSHSLQVSCSSS
jgi:hypothetical protein